MSQEMSLKQKKWSSTILMSHILWYVLCMSLFKISSCFLFVWFLLEKVAKFNNNQQSHYWYQYYKLLVLPF